MKNYIYEMNVPEQVNPETTCEVAMGMLAYKKINILDFENYTNNELKNSLKEIISIITECDFPEKYRKRIVKIYQKHNIYVQGMEKI